jgi:hypothetical protein
MLSIIQKILLFLNNKARTINIYPGTFSSHTVSDTREECLRIGREAGVLMG